MFYCEFCEISKDTFLNRTPLVAPSGLHMIIFWYLLKFLTHLFIYLFIYLLVYLFIFFSHLYSLLFLTFILPINHLLYLLSQSILYYYVSISFYLISYVPNLLLLMLQYYYLTFIMYLLHIN